MKGLGRWVMVLWIGYLSSVLGVDFDKSMGRGTTAWNHIRTPEDQQRFAMIKTHFGNHYFLSADPIVIPKIIHWVWLGPQPISEKSKKNIMKWIQLHPDWTFKLWVDQQIDFELKRLDVYHVDKCLALGATKGVDCYFNADNFREKSEILRLLILLLQGGVYLDHDMEPLKAIDPICHAIHFFAGLEILQPTILSSSVYAGTNMIGAIPNHPIIDRALNWVVENWERLEAQYPVTDQSSMINRVKHRSAIALDQGVFTDDFLGNRDFLFPSAFFNQTDCEKALFAVHSHAHSWLPQQEYLHWNATVEALEKKITTPWVITLILGLINLVLCCFLIQYLCKKRKKCF